jgi:hypothetical protein
LRIGEVVWVTSWRQASDTSVGAVRDLAGDTAGSQLAGRVAIEHDDDALGGSDEVALGFGEACAKQGDSWQSELVQPHD